MDALEAAYRTPMPRVEFATVVRGLATASADVSDGLLADAGHIAKASGLQVKVDLDRLPLSTGARKWLEAQPERGQHPDVRRDARGAREARQER